jgi:predicted N-acetyltransferase YhbS
VAYRPPEPLDDRHRLDDFDSGSQPLDDWLKRHARQAHASGSARVFVTVESDDEDHAVIGYFGLAAAQVEASEATERSLKGQPKLRPVPAVLLARLAVDIAHQEIGVGKSLLKDAMLRCLAASEHVGIRVLLVHAKDQVAKDWYMQFDFEESATDPLHLMMLMKDLRAAAK